jgi:hypothetical protein
MGGFSVDASRISVVRRVEGSVLVVGDWDGVVLGDALLVVEGGVPLALVEYVDDREEDLRVEGVNRDVMAFAAKALALTGVAWSSASDAFTSARRRRTEKRGGMRCIIPDHRRAIVHAIVLRNLQAFPLGIPCVLYLGTVMGMCIPQPDPTTCDSGRPAALDGKVEVGRVEDAMRTSRYQDECPADLP